MRALKNEVCFSVGDMKIFIATDSSKGSLTSSVAGAAVKEVA